jgi:hypothetical protein
LYAYNTPSPPNPNRGKKNYTNTLWGAHPEKSPPPPGTENIGRRHLGKRILKRRREKRKMSKKEEERQKIKRKFKGKIMQKGQNKVKKGCMRGNF